MLADIGSCRYLDDFEEALYGPDFTDPDQGWRKFANESAWVDWFLAIELIRNVKHSYHSAAWITKVCSSSPCIALQASLPAS